MKTEVLHSFTEISPWVWLAAAGIAVFQAGVLALIRRKVRARRRGGK